MISTASEKCKKVVNYFVIFVIVMGNYAGFTWIWCRLKAFWWRVTSESVKKWGSTLGGKYNIISIICESSWCACNTASRTQQEWKKKLSVLGKDNLVDVLISVLPNTGTCYLFIFCMSVCLYIYQLILIHVSLYSFKRVATEESISAAVHTL